MWWCGSPQPYKIFLHTLNLVYSKLYQRIPFFRDKVRCTPLTVIVKRRLPLRASVTDKGFQPKIIAIDQGDTIEWSWKECTVPHSIQEVNYLLDKGVFVKTQWQDGGRCVLVVNHYIVDHDVVKLYFDKHVWILKFFSAMLYEL